MAVTAYILVKSNTSEVDRVKEAIEANDGITQANIVAGDVDFIAKVSVETPGEVKDIVASGIQTISGVENTQTYIAMG
ncbi:AsnC-like helix-turn-helix protein [Halohasta litchfieldiae]|jgi:DNA-binding Lrp family transcriptional regulator|uniref:Transcriptional regulator, AsnC family n=1 Tax=Halohasta litchfieldiae TaxID=1073996 RepID=A0A1H6RPF2_9EURY|nr:Lrp/AsnC ligand binding domain-containing protein [Halohasta litchfieldiae]ATW89764.1 AsnC-like helix-turn-helix protein [Halohasta litchfieldiae]SEI53082.1 transcriptional regulator, AsnC family [Halohasta litchfieldiae]